MGAIPRFRFPLSNKEIAELRVDLNQSSIAKKAEIEKFEKLFAKYVRKNYAIFLPSARFGLYQILKGLRLREGDGVIVPAWTHHSVPSMIVAAGLHPLFVDVEGGTYNMSPNTIPPEFWKKAKVMILTHLYGCPAPAEELSELAKANNVTIIEDCAQSLGATIHGTLTGAYGFASIFSLSITKNLTTLKGGMVCTDDKDLAQNIRNSRNEQQTPTEELKTVLDTCEKANKFLKPFIFNTLVYPGLIAASLFGIDPIHSRFHEPVSTKKPPEKVPSPHPVQAILGQKKIRRLDKHNELRNANGKFLLDNLKGIKGVVIPRFAKGHYHIFMSFVIMVEDSFKTKQALLMKGIDTSPGYLRNCADMREFEKFKVKCKMAQNLEYMQLHIPIYPGLTKDELLRIARAIVDVCAK